MVKNSKSLRRNTKRRGNKVNKSRRRNTRTRMTKRIKRRNNRKRLSRKKLSFRKLMRGGSSWADSFKASMPATPSATSEERAEARARLESEVYGSSGEEGHGETELRIEFEYRSEREDKVLIGKISSSNATCKIALPDTPSGYIVLAHIDLGDLSGRYLCKPFFKAVLTEFFRRFPDYSSNKFKINSVTNWRVRSRALNCYNSVLSQFGYEHTMEGEDAKELNSTEWGPRYWIKDT